MRKIVSGFVFGLIWLVSLLPLRVLYLISDFVFLLFLICPPLRYRRGVVRRNLCASFPDRDRKWLRRTERRFYRHLCDLLVESLKCCSMPMSVMSLRMRVVGLDMVQDLMDNGRSVVAYLGHLGNWEWISSLGAYSKPGQVAAQVYHPLENKIMDDVMLRIRSQYGAVSIPMDKVLRRLMEYNAGKKPFIIGMIADQVPLWWAIHHWTEFLHQDTPVFNGTERIARKLDTAVVYTDISRLGRGRYQMEFKMMTEHPRELPENALTDLYFKMLEDNINREPELWLWTHRRWKRTRKGYQQWLEQRGQDLKK